MQPNNDYMSDMSKDALGFRLRKDWNNMDQSEIDRWLKYFQSELEANRIRQHKDESEAIEAFETHLANLQNYHGAFDRKAALRWTIDPDGKELTTQDVEAVLWDWQLSFEDIDRLTPEIMAAIKCE